MNRTINELTEKLLEYNALFLKYYQQARETGEKKDFHHIIKPFVDEVESVKKEWKLLMKKRLSNSRHTHIYEKQVETTADHISTLAIQCFFAESSKTRFLNSQRTVEYVLREVLKEIKDMKKDA
ncbi:DUF1798 family protein [Neobacillus kokaensis]|uniref:DUF1798 family protein n=1 Tax=Neobacillus kokaensis TaxID=2759023 RepID=A0ABQ3N0M3_9BACI|nr:DUF1798 family protein [Neobacillus kokaensis]GHH98222.1 hypothetical protein AM1BK_17650 [Neobacillus kokaensis]